MDKTVDQATEQARRTKEKVCEGLKETGEKAQVDF
jgi:hypothetical protein